VLGRYDDIAAALDAVRERIGGQRTEHRDLGTRVELVSPTRAELTCEMASRRWLGDGRVVRTRGRYTDVLELGDGGWRIASLRLVSTYREQ
jgi:hypothetical protein